MHFISRGWSTRAALLALLVSPLAAFDVVETGQVILEEGEDPILVGMAIAIGDGVTLIGGNIGTGPGFEAGSVCVVDTATGQELRKLLPQDGAPGLNFGFSISISGDTALVSANASLFAPPGPTTGGAYLFEISTGLQIGTLSPTGGTPDDRFGSAVALDGTTAAVGARWDNQLQGAVYLFDVTTGQQTFKLQASDAMTVGGFGQRLDISGTTLLVSAVGTAYLFDTTTGQELFKLVAPDSEFGDQFGASVAISEKYALIGVPLDNDAAQLAGAAYVFDSATGQELYKLFSGNPLRGDLFGNAVSIDGNYALVGAQQSLGFGAALGKASLFDLGSGQEVALLMASDGMSLDAFGATTAISGDVAVCAAPFRNGVTTGGSAYLFDISALGTLASVTSRNGSGVNGSIFLSQRDPVLGLDWNASLAASGHADGLAVVVIYEGASSGTILSGGELLVDTTSAIITSITQSHSGGVVAFAIDVPDDISLCGLQGSAQGVVFGAPGYELSNALDLVLGR